MSDIDTARLRAEIAEWRAVGFKTDDYPLDTVRLMRLLDRIDSLERTAAAAGRALREAQTALAQAGRGEADDRHCMNCAAFGKCTPNNDARRCGYEPDAPPPPQQGETR